MIWYSFFSGTVALRVLITLSFIVVALPAQAGRPMVVDDAGIVGAKSCQLESWIQKNQNTTEYWAVPACNFSGNLEVALGGARFISDEESQSVAVIQGKTLFKALDANGWGVGLVFGSQFNTNTGVGDHYVSVPITLSFQDDRFLLHTNLGWLRGKETKRDAMTWGLGVETRLTDRTILTSETYGQHQGKPFYQLGIRHWVVPNKFQLDASYGNRLSDSDAQRFFSIGLVLFTDAILP